MFKVLDKPINERLPCSDREFESLVGLNSIWFLIKDRNVTVLPIFITSPPIFDKLVINM